MSKLEVDAIEPQSGTTITIGSSGDTVNLVGTLNSNGSPLPGDISSVVAGTGLSGGGTTGAVTLNIEAAQPTITSLGTITGFTSTGIDDNATSTAITIDSGQNVGIGTATPNAITGYGALTIAGNTWGGFLDFEHGSTLNSSIVGASNGLNILTRINQPIMFKVNATEGMRLTSTGLGIGTTSPATKLQVTSASSGVTPNGNADELFVEGSGNVGITIGSGTANSGQLCFGDSGDNNVGEIAYLHDVNAMRFSVNGPEKMRIDSSGKVGIGTSSPSSILHAETTTGAELILSRNDTSIAVDDLIGGIQFKANDASSSPDPQICGIKAISTGATNTNPKLSFFAGESNYSANTPNMVIDSSGNVGINKTPSNLLDLAVGTFQIRTTPGAGVWGLSAGTDGSSFSRISISSSGTGTQTKMAFFNTNGEVGSITTNGSATAFNTSSDYRLKENVSYDFDATTRLKQLKPARFNFIADADKTVDGFIAHEVSSVVPEAISGEKDEVETYTDDDGNEQTKPKYQGIDQSKLVPLLVKTIQELEARITTLENA